MKFLNGYASVEPESTACIPSMKLDNASTGNTDAKYLTTSFSLVYKKPQTFLAATRAKPRDKLSATAKNITIRTAKHAASGLPAPNSFETLVL